MSMSTRIEDLPGSIPDDIRNDIHDIAIRHQEEEVVRSNTLQNQNIPSVENDMTLHNTNTSNITASIKKRVKFQDEIDTTSVIEFLKNEINEENLLLFIILIFASRDDFDGVILRIPFINKYTESSFTVILLRCLLLLLIYILLRHYVIPKIKL